MNICTQAEKSDILCTYKENKKMANDNKFNVIFFQIKLLSDFLKKNLYSYTCFYFLYFESNLNEVEIKYVHTKSFMTH